MMTILRLTRFTISSREFAGAYCTGRSHAFVIPEPALGGPAWARVDFLKVDLVVDMDSSGSAITSETDHMVLDFQGHTLRNVARQPFSSVPAGVSADERSHVVVRNGTVAGFWEGISLSEPFDAPTSFDRLVATSNAILMEDTGTAYRNNFVLQIAAGATAFSGGVDAGGNVSYGPAGVPTASKTRSNRAGTGPGRGPAPSRSSDRHFANACLSIVPQWAARSG